MKDITGAMANAAKGNAGRPTVTISQNPKKTSDTLDRHGNKIAYNPATRSWDVVEYKQPGE